MIHVAQSSLPGYGRVAYLLLRLLPLLILFVHVRNGLHNAIRLLLQMRQVQVIVYFTNNIDARSKFRIILIGEAHATALRWKAIHLSRFVRAVKVLTQVTV